MGTSTAGINGNQPPRLMEITGDQGCFQLYMGTNWDWWKRASYQQTRGIYPGCNRDVNGLYVYIYIHNGICWIQPTIRWGFNGTLWYISWIWLGNMIWTKWTPKHLGFRSERMSGCRFKSSRLFSSLRRWGLKTPRLRSKSQRIHPWLCQIFFSPQRGAPQSCNWQ